MARFRVGLEFAFSGHRQLDGMITQHARLARTLAEQLELPTAVREGVGAAYEQWDGHGWPGSLKAGAIPVAARIAQFAEFIEVAHRVGDVAGATALARRRAGRQFDPDLAGLLCSHAEEIFAGLEAASAWRTVIAAEPALAVELSSNKQIAERLVITPKTAGNHVEHIYAKIGASSRAGAAMFAVQQITVSYADREETYQAGDASSSTCSHRRSTGMPRARPAPRRLTGGWLRPGGSGRLGRAGGFRGSGG